MIRKIRELSQMRQTLRRGNGILCSSRGMTDIQMREQDRNDIVSSCTANASAPLNAFALLHDDAQLEKFHSLVISRLIDANRHSLGKLLLDGFLDLLINKARTPEQQANLTRFKDDVRRCVPNIEVEHSISGDGKHGFVDIVIFNSRKSHVIIIENKMNNAPDMPRQIPRYIEAFERKNIEPLAVVYIKAFDKDGFPNVDKMWLPEDEAKVRGLLIPLSACATDDSQSLVHGWIEKATGNGTLAERDRVVLEQYAQFVCGDAKNDEEMTRLCNRLLAGEISEEERQVAIRYIVRCILSCGAMYGFGKGCFMKREERYSRSSACHGALYDCWWEIRDDYKIELGIDFSVSGEGDVKLELFAREDGKRFVRRHLDLLKQLCSCEIRSPEMVNQRRRKSLAWTFDRHDFADKESFSDAVADEIGEVLMAVAECRESFCGKIADLMKSEGNGRESDSRHGD